MYSDYLRAAREAKKEDSIDLSRSPRPPATDGPTRPRATSFFSLRKLKGSQHSQRNPLYTLLNWMKKASTKARIRKVMILMGLRG